LKEFLEKGKDIIITTIQKFPVISETISQLKSKSFGVIIDEVHSSQSGETSKHLKKSLSKGDEPDTGDDEDEVDYEDMIREEIQSRGKQPHISFFGFTGTPKNKTLELFGRKNESGQFVPFHTYTMRQSIIEGFTLDVLQNYTTYKRYFKVHEKDGKGDVELPEGQVKKELVQYTDSHPETIRQKVSIILHHFVNKTSKKIEGVGRGMVVVRSRYHCVLFQQEMVKQMKEMGLPYSCLVAFSGSINHNGRENTESSLNTDNGMTGSIPDGFKDPRYRILIVSNKYQTGFDEPMIQSMYVDKKLNGVQCVQTLSRLNRKMTGKEDTFVLDFVNDTELIVNSFQPYYTTTLLTGETDPDKLYDMVYKIEGFNLYTKYQLDEFCKEFYKKNDSDEKLHPIIDVVVNTYVEKLTEEQQVEFKSLIQSYIRLYSYISQISSFGEIHWEKTFVFLRFLNKKLPKGKDERISVLDSVNLDSLRIQMIGESNLSLEVKTGELEPISNEGGKGKDETPMELLSEIIKKVNETYGMELKDEDRITIDVVYQKLTQNEDLQKVFLGNNSSDVKKEELKRVFKDEMVDYTNDRMDFYKNVMNPKVLPILIDFLFSQYSQGRML
jgi:type I restriction enzyme R subunit